MTISDGKYRNSFDSIQLDNLCKYIESSLHLQKKNNYSWLNHIACSRFVYIAFIRIHSVHSSSLKKLQPRGAIKMYYYYYYLTFFNLPRPATATATASTATTTTATA